MSMFGPRGQVPRACPDYSSLTTDPHRSTFQQPRLYSTKRQKPEKPLWLDTCHHRSNLISVPFFIAGGVKIVYDLWLYREFVAHKPDVGDSERTDDAMETRR